MKKLLATLIVTTLSWGGSHAFAQNPVELRDSVDAAQAQLDSLMDSTFGNVTLGEATVKAQKVMIKNEIDKVTYQMSEDPDAQTNPLLDMLRKVPMVTVDGDDNIKVNGSSSFKIYVNGKPNQMISSNPSLVLKNFPASMVKKVEVITDPGAKYDAEGVTGILNIVTETGSQTSGWTLSPRVDAGNRGTNVSLFGMAQTGKFTVSANYMYGRFYEGRMTMNQDNTYMGTDPRIYHLLHSTTLKPDGQFHYGSVEASYEFTPRDLLSLNFGIHGYLADSYAPTSVLMSGRDGQLTYSYNSALYGKNKNLGFSAGVDYQHIFRPLDATGGTDEYSALTLSYRLNHTPSYEHRRNIYSDFEGDKVLFELMNNDEGLRDMYSRPDNKAQEHTVQLDYSVPFLKHHTVSTGVKYIRRNNESDSEELRRLSGTDDPFVRYEPNSLHYQHLNDIKSLYAEYTYKLGNFTARGGLRYEHSHVSVSYLDGKRDPFAKNFSDLVPSVSFGYKLKETQMLKLTYNARVGRPDISYLSPYCDRSNPQSLSYGNPKLESERAHNLSASYSYFDMKFSISTTLSFNTQNNGLTSYVFVDKDNILNKTYQNFMHKRSLGLNVFLNWTIVPGTQLNLNLDGSYKDLSVRQIGAKNNGFGMFAFAGIRQNLPWELIFSVNGGGGVPEVQLQGKGSSFYFYSFSLTRSFLKEKRLTVSLNAVNIFSPHRDWEQHITTPQYISDSITRMSMSRFSIGISWRLGKLQTSVKKAARTINNDDVQSSSSSNNAQGAMGGTGQGVY